MFFVIYEVFSSSDVLTTTFKKINKPIDRYTSLYSMLVNIQDKLLLVYYSNYSMSKTLLYTV